MKNLILILSAASTLLLSAAVTATPMPQSDGDINVRSVLVMRVNANTVDVAFQIELIGEVTALNRSLIIRPVLHGQGGERVELPPIIVRGARAPLDAENRAMSAVGIPAEGRHVTANGGTLDYRTSTRWRDWMDGSRLVLSGLNTGRDRATEVSIGTVADNLMAGQGSPTPAAAPINEPVRQPDTQPATQPAAPAPPAIGTIGDELAARFTFVEPVAKFNRARGASSIDAVFDYTMPLLFGASTIQPEDDVARFIEMTREGALHIKFDRGSGTLGRDLGENNNRLVDLVSAIRILQSNPQTRIARVIVVGFSAPEGGIEEKETLAMERAVVTRDLLTANSRIDPAVIDIYNGSADWTTLRSLVSASNIAEKYKVLDIIDNVPAWGTARDKGRLAQLMALNDGDVFRYMREKFFPLLRQTGAYVKVYYENIR